MSIGGQAVIEGVMFRNDNKVATSVRLEDNTIITKKETLSQRPKWFKWLFVRGIVNLLDTLIIGLKSLSWSANQGLEDEEEISTLGIISTLLVSFGFALLLFVALPFFITKLIHLKGLIFNIFEGFLRISIFLGYLLIISSMSDIQTLFQYHGAEHKVANCHEYKEKCNLSNSKKYSTQHHRCGTAFLVLVLIISIIVFSLIPSSTWYIKLGSRILLIPVIASLSYEMLKLSFKHQHNPFFKVIAKPGLWLQNITTKEPTEKQLEVALKAFENVQ